MIDINYLWNFEEPKDVKWDPFPLYFLKIKNGRFVLVPELQLTMQGVGLDHNAYNKLPLCTNGNAQGRFVKTELIQTRSKRLSLESDWAIPRDSMTQFKDLEDRIWVPYDCRYSFFSYSDLISCISQNITHIHVYGDSNIRRSLKALTTGGAWCNTLYNPASRECECSDQGKVAVPYLTDALFVNFFPKVAGSANVSILYERVNGFYSQQASFDKILKEAHLQESLAKFGQNVSADVVIFNLGKVNNQTDDKVNWDAGFFKWKDFQENISKIIQSIKELYGHTPLIFRTGQYFSGRKFKNIFI